MIRKLRLKLGSSADKRCVWLRQCAATSDMKAEVFGSFLVCEAKWEKNEGCDRIVIPHTGRSDASRNRKTVAVLQEERQKQSCSFPRCLTTTCHSLTLSISSCCIFIFCCHQKNISSSLSFCAMMSSFVGGEGCRRLELPFRCDINI